MTIQLMWAPPPLYQQNGVITSYLINVTERETGLVFSRSTTALRTVFTNLHPDYVYECRVAAITVAQGPYTLIFAIRVLVSCKSYQLLTLLHLSWKILLCAQLYIHVIVHRLHAYNRDFELSIANCLN